MEWQKWEKTSVQDRRQQDPRLYKEGQAQVRVMHRDASPEAPLDYRVHMLLSALMLAIALVLANLR